VSTRAITPAVAAPVAVLTPPQRPTLQRTCDCGEHTGGGECEECKTKKKMPLQRHANGIGAPPAVPPIVHEVLSSPGQALDSGTRAFMETRFRQDFSHVRVHTDERAAESARAVSAHAYTVGEHIAFGSGRYAPQRPAGRWLLAHEMAHTRQQPRVTTDLPQTPLGVPGSASETEANRAAESVAVAHSRAARPPVLTQLHSAILQRLSLGEGIGIGVGIAAGLAAIGGLVAGLIARSRRLMHWETKVPDVPMVDDPGQSRPTSTIVLPENTRLVIVDEGANRPFNRGDQHWVEVRVTVGPFLNKVGWVQRNQLESRPETEEISPEQASEIFTALAHANIATTEGEAPIPFHYPPDGCYARAHRMEELLTEMGYGSEKVFALSGKRPLVAETQYASDVEGHQVTWAWHVAPIVKVRDPQRGLIETVLDPSLYERPISLTDWEGLMGDSRTFTRLSLSEVREQMRSGELTKHERVAVTAPRYTYGPGDLPHDETHEEAEAEDVAVRPRITVYTHEAPVHELAAFIRRQLHNAVVDATAILRAIRATTRAVRLAFKAQFVRLLKELRQHISSSEADQVDSALEQ
jgi:hypothetical protein